MNRFHLSAAALLLGSFAASAAELAHRPALTLDAAKAAVAAATAYAQAHNAPGAAIAVVDGGGQLICLERLDGTFAASANVSAGKARTAALFGKPTAFFEDVVNKGRTSMTALPDFTPLQGGVPIVAAGTIVGAIGVSGAASAAQDAEIAEAGARAVATLAVAH